jgi:hypothetical protein
MLAGVRNVLPGVSARMEPPSDRLRQEEILDHARGYLAGRGIEARMLAKVGPTSFCGCAA